jgi:hypothetical protein
MRNGMLLNELQPYFNNVLISLHTSRSNLQLALTAPMLKISVRPHRRRQMAGKPRQSREEERSQYLNLHQILSAPTTLSNRRQKLVSKATGE